MIFVRFWFVFLVSPVFRVVHYSESNVLVNTVF